MIHSQLLSENIQWEIPEIIHKFSFCCQSKQHNEILWSRAPFLSSLSGCVFCTPCPSVVVLVVRQNVAVLQL